MFSLTREEIMNLSQIVISSKIKHAPNVFVFAEQGVAMLSSVLNSKQAIQVNIGIMRVFVNIRKLVSSNKEVINRLNQLEEKVEKQGKKIKRDIKTIFEVIHRPYCLQLQL